MTRDETPRDPLLPMADTEFLFRVGVALGQTMAPKPMPSLPRLAPGQRYFQVWSEPDHSGYRQLLTFEVMRS